MNWQLNMIQYPVYNLGPGRRLGIWVQGCDLGCKNCINKSTWSKSNGNSVPVLDLFNWLVEIENAFDGITISGGEPFQQYESMMCFLHLVKLKTNLNVFCFSGYYLNELDEMFPDLIFYKYIDYLMDGRYELTLPHNENIKGSSNQTLYEFIDNKPVQIDDYSNRKMFSINVSEDSQVHLVGIPKKGDLGYVEKVLNKKSVKVNFK